MYQSVKKRIINKAQTHHLLKNYQYWSNFNYNCNVYNIPRRFLSLSSHLSTIFNNENKNNYNNNYNYNYYDTWKLYIMMSVFGLTLNMINSLYNNKVKACGIMAVISNNDENVVDYLLEGLSILQNRGYDSAGIATVHPNEPAEIAVTKYASKGTTSDSLDLLKKEAPTNHYGDYCGIAHTRWATHGSKTDVNAHPHLDYKNRIALAHNGTIENCTELKNELKKKGITFRSETDTEVICNLIGHYLDQGYNEEDSLKHTLSRLDGSWGIAMISKNRPREIFVARNGSPLMIGLNQEEGRNFIASEHTAFARHTNQYIPLKDGEIAIVKADDVSLDKSRILLAPSEKIELSPSPYPYWTIKEIMEQPAAVSRALAYGSRLSDEDKVKLGGLEKEEELLMGIKHLIITGCGTSYFASLYGQRLMQYLNSFETVHVVNSAEVIPDCLPSQNAGMLAVSQSGETKDVLNAIQCAEMLSIPRFSITNCVGSAIARATGLGVYIYAGREYAVASTKAFLTQVTVLSLISAWFAQKRSQKDEQQLQYQQRGYSRHRRGSNTVDVVDRQRRNSLVDALHRLSTFCGVTLRVLPECQEIAKELKDAKHLFVLGKGFAEPIAYEGALKIKELTYIHAEGYSGGALKHGPFALIEEGTPIIMIIPDDNHAKTMITNAHEVESRGAKTYFITNNPDLCQGLKGKVIKIPSNGPLTALLAVIPLQFIAYELSILKKINPDKPKNLAKAVTVD